MPVLIRLAERLRWRSTNRAINIAICATGARYNRSACGRMFENGYLFDMSATESVVLHHQRVADSCDVKVF